MVDHLKLQQRSCYTVKVLDDPFCLWCGKNSWMLIRVINETNKHDALHGWEMPNNFTINLLEPAKPELKVRHAILPAERDPWVPVYGCTAAEPTWSDRPLGASPCQWGGQVSASCRCGKPFQCPGHNFVKFADTSHQSQDLGCPVCFWENQRYKWFSRTQTQQQ